MIIVENKMYKNEKQKWRSRNVYLLVGGSGGSSSLSIPIIVERKCSELA